MIGDAIRIFCVSLLTAFLMFLLQPWLFQSEIIAITDIQDVETWLGEQYTLGASLVFGITLFATLLWYVLATNAKVSSAADVSRMRPVWGILLLLPILSICAALYFFNKSNDALLWLVFLYVVDIVIGFWLATAISSPKLLKYVPPGSITLRNTIPGLK